MSVLTLRPNGDLSAVLQQRPSTPGTHYILIDEATLDEADYCNCEGSPTRTLTDIYQFPNHSSESGTINSVTVKCQCKEVVSGTPGSDGSVNLAVRIADTNYFGGAQTLTTSTALYSSTWNTNPNTSSAWSWTDIDDLLAGDALTNVYVGKQNFANVACYQLWVEVTYGEGGGATVKPHYYYLQQ